MNTCLIFTIVISQLLILGLQVPDVTCVQQQQHQHRRRKPATTTTTNTTTRYGINRNKILKTDNYDIFYGWKKVDYNFPSEDIRAKMISNKEYIVGNNLITALKISGDRMFLTVPRFQPGIPSTLNYVPYNGILGNQTGPLLTPYPNWEMQSPGNCSALQAVQSMEIDQYNRMWIIDIGRLNVLTDKPDNKCPPKLLLVDLKTDSILMSYTFPNEVISYTEGFPKDLTVACSTLTQCILYIADITGGRIIIYDHEKQNSRFVTHPTMQPDPAATNVTIWGKTYYNPFGISGVGLSPRDRNHDIFYYAPLASFWIYSVKTKDLLSSSPGSTLPTEQITIVGKRPSQADGMTMDSRGRLYFGALELNSVYSWKINPESKRIRQRCIAHNDTDIVWQDTFGFDNERGHLFLITDRYQLSEDHAFDFEQVNFRALRFPINAKSYIYPA